MTGTVFPETVLPETTRPSGLGGLRDWCDDGPGIAADRRRCGGRGER
jgi:hypothetical protein